MTLFCELPAIARTALLTLLLCAVLGALVLLLKVFRAGRLGPALPDGCLLAGLVLAIALLKQDHPANGACRPIPALTVVGLLLAAAACLAVEGARERRRRRTGRYSGRLRQHRLPGCQRCDRRHGSHSAEERHGLHRVLRRGRPEVLE